MQVDLRSYQCPQLFVQFKYVLNHQRKNHKTIRFIYEHTQHVDDILVHLKNKHYDFVDHKINDSLSYIEVNL